MHFILCGQDQFRQYQYQYDTLEAANDAARAKWYCMTRDEQEHIRLNVLESETLQEAAGGFILEGAFLYWGSTGKDRARQAAFAMCYHARIETINSGKGKNHVRTNSRKRKTHKCS
jgi:hypothetical protein